MRPASVASDPRQQRPGQVQFSLGSARRWHQGPPIRNIQLMKASLIGVRAFRHRMRALSRVVPSKDVVLLLIGSGTTILGAYLGRGWQRESQDVQIAADNRHRVQLAATAAFDELSRAANEVTRLEQQVFAAAEEDPSAPPLDSALRAMDIAAGAWRRNVPRLEALGRAYFCFSGQYLIASTDHMLNYYFESVREVRKQGGTELKDGAPRTLTPAEREAWRQRALWLRTNFPRDRSPMDEQVKVITSFQRWMVEMLRMGVAGRETANCG